MDRVDAETTAKVKSVVLATLGIDEQNRSIDASTPLLGGLPELDSLAAVELVAALESRFDVTIDDDEVNAEVFETLGTLAALIDAKLTSRTGATSA